MPDNYIPEEEMPFALEDAVEEEDSDNVSREDFLSAVKRVIYGTESLLETIDIDWSDEIAAITEDIDEVRKLWPKEDDL